MARSLPGQRLLARPREQHERAEGPARKALTGAGPRGLSTCCQARADTDTARWAAIAGGLGAHTGHMRPRSQRGRLGARRPPSRAEAMRPGWSLADEPAR